METFVAVLGALLLLAANVSMSEAQTVKSYFKAGGDLRLSPVPVSEPITSIVWKYERNLLAEWAGGSIELTYYNRFKGRSKLDIVTGKLLIQNMTTEDNGVYSVEINNKVQSQVYQAVEIEEVPQPTVDVQPLSCNLPQTCALKCNGDVNKAQPVEYFWKKDDGEWEQSGDKRELSKEEMRNVTTFYCRMKNPLSEKEGKLFPNPFTQEPKPPESSSSGEIAGGIFGVIGVAALIGLGYWKKDEIGQKIKGQRSDRTPGPTPRVDTQENRGLIKTNSESNTSGKPTSDDDDDKLKGVKSSTPTPKPSANGDKGEGDGGCPVQL